MTVRAFQPEPEPPDPLLGKVFEERYRIEKPLGEGGLGRVYTARHLTLGRMVALKVLLTQYESVPELQKRFQREAEALASLSHPNIVTVTDFGVTERHAYIVMELLEGADLWHVIHTSPPLSPKRVFDIARQMLRALAYAHGRDLVHRDLKPQNVFVRAMDDGTDHVTVLDFGLARFVGDSAKSSPKLTQHGALIGTPAYMAPEQASGGDVDARADIYAAGCVIFEALTGRRVFDGSNPGDVLRQHLLNAAPMIAQADTGLQTSQELEAFVHRALEKSPAARFQSVQEMIAALDALSPDSIVRVGPRPPRDQPINSVAKTQAPGGVAMAATNAGTPRAKAALPAESMPTLPKSRLPLFAGVGCALAGALGGVALIGWLFVSGAFGGETPPAPVPPEEIVSPTPPPPPDPTPEPPPRPAARDPFAPPLTPPFDRLHRAAGRAAPASVARQTTLPSNARALLQEIENEIPATDARRHVLLGHVWGNHGRRNPRFYEAALREYEQAYDLDESVRGDPQMVRDLAASSQNEQLADPTAVFVTRAYGREAIPFIDATLDEEGLPRAHRERLERLKARIEASVAE